MTGKERFYRTTERKPVDRPASWLGLPDPKALPELCGYFGVQDIDGLREAVSDDVYPVELPCCFPGSNFIYSALQFAKKQTGPERTLTAPGFFEDYSDPSKIVDFDWPDPAAYVNPAACHAAVESAPIDKAVLGVLWSAHFQDACSAFGMETALVKMLEEPDIRAKVRELKEIFPTGLIISPSHEAILPDVPPVNIKALFDAVLEN